MVLRKKKQSKTREHRTERIETSVTLSYRESNWGIERIALDGIANHLPEDAKGSNVWVKLKQGSKYVDLKEADPEKPVKEIIFEDDGKGYDSRKLSVLFSDKAADSLSVGQIGEGLKLVAAASLRKGLDLTYSSRNWVAKPFAKRELIDGSNLERLCFNVEIDGENIKGSRTHFITPSKDFVDEIFNLPNKVLALNDDYKELYNEKDKVETEADVYDNFGLASIFGTGVNKSEKYHSRIIDLHKKEKGLFVKGIRFNETRNIFDYDLGLENINPDRVYVHRGALLREIKDLLTGCSNKKVIKKVLREANNLPNKYCDEFEAFAPKTPWARDDRYEITEPRRYRGTKALDKTIREKISKKHKDNLWAKCFKEVFRKDAVLASRDVNVNKDAELMGYNPIRLNQDIQNYLSCLGIQRASDIENESEYRWVPYKQLTNKEKKTLRRVRELDSIAVEDVGREPTKIRVYSGMFLQTGRQVECSNGVRMREHGKKPYIGLKRSVLQDPELADRTYLHEIGHEISEQGDYDRGFTHFFVQGYARLARKEIERQKAKGGKK